MDAKAYLSVRWVQSPHYWIPMVGRNFLVYVQFEPKSGPNITEYVRKLLFMQTALFNYIAISDFLHTYSYGCDNTVGRPEAVSASQDCDPKRMRRNTLKISIIAMRFQAVPATSISPI